MTGTGMMRVAYALAACLLIAALWAAYTGKVPSGPHAPHMPRLIGHGCDGAGGDLFADEESDFPTRCDVIERNGE